MLFHQVIELLLQLDARLLHMVEKARLKDQIERGQTHGGRQRIAAIGGAVRASHHALASLARRQKSAQRKAAADAFGDRHNVWRHANKLMGE